MDTWLYRGDHKKNEQGFVEKISGGMEKIQRAIIRLSVPKGSFALDEELGSKLSMLGKVPGNQREELALEYAREAILPVEGVEVTSVQCRQADFEKLVLEMTLEYSGEDAPKEQAMFLWQMNF